MPSELQDDDFSRDSNDDDVPSGLDGEEDDEIDEGDEDEDAEGEEEDAEGEDEDAEGEDEDAEGEEDEDGADAEDQELYCYCQKLSYGEVRLSLSVFVSLCLCLCRWTPGAAACGGECEGCDGGADSFCCLLSLSCCRSVLVSVDADDRVRQREVPVPVGEYLGLFLSHTHPDLIAYVILFYIIILSLLSSTIPYPTGPRCRQ